MPVGCQSYILLTINVYDKVLLSAVFGFNTAAVLLRTQAGKNEYFLQLRAVFLQ